MSHVLVTGAAGFVGLSLTRNLLERGNRVVAVTRDRTRPLPEGASVAYGDVTDPDFCRRVLADYEVDFVFHLAAQSIVSVCAQDPIAALGVAVMGTARLLQGIRDVGRPCVAIVMTSDKVYGSAPSPYTEETPLEPQHAYEVSKACQSFVARMYHRNYDVDVREVRAVNIYGPGDPNGTRVIPRNVHQLLAGGAPTIHAGAHGMRRQYVYIDDVVEALLIVAARGAPGEAYCVGGPDDPMSVAEVIGALAVACGVDRAPETAPRDPRFREIEAQSANDSKLRRLGWSPKVVFSEGLRRTISAARGEVGR